MFDVYRLGNSVIVTKAVLIYGYKCLFYVTSVKKWYMCVIICHVGRLLSLTPEALLWFAGTVVAKTSGFVPEGLQLHIQARVTWIL